jgi:hypothetical protein
MAGTIVANTINTDTGVFTTNNAYQGIAKAWVNFVGSSGSINGSFNVSSVTRDGTGQYRVNFTTAMPNANYAATAGSSIDNTIRLDVYTTLAIRCVIAATALDAAVVSVAIFSS